MSNYFETIIIGSGISGLMTLKHLKEKDHNNVLVLEKNKSAFGVWNIDNHPSVLPETYCVSSKLYMTISDFPMEEDTPEFPHHSDILKYYQRYAQQFNLFKHIKYNTYVLKALKVDSNWVLETNQGIYKSKNLVVATGTVNSKLNIPNEPFYKNFTGSIYHSDDFKKIREQLSNKKILLIGVSETSCDLALILKNNNKVAMSSRNGVWMQNRNLGAYSPADMLYNRYSQQCIKCLGKKIYNKTFFVPFSESFLKMWGYNGHGIPEWRTNSDYLSSIWNKNRDILNYISNHNSLRPKLVVGFAAETNNLENNAIEKLNSKNCDMIIANDVSNNNIGFDSDFNEVKIFYKNNKEEKLFRKRKSLISEEIVERINNQLN